MKQEPQFLARENLQILITLLSDAGFECIGPQVRNHAIIFAPISHIDQLPQGITELQSPGTYTLKYTDSPAWFRWTTGPQAIKPYLFAAHEILWSVRKETDGALQFNESLTDQKKLALLGVRACDIAAMYIQDKHFLHEQCKDPYYQSRRQNLFLIGVNCSRSAETCFCNSTGDGPQLAYGYDLGLSELDDGFLIDGLSHSGNEMLKKLPTVKALPAQIAAASDAIDAARKQQRRLPSDNLRNILFDNLDHPHWQDIAQRCLSCGNCTAVCPTCFCHSEADMTALDGQQSEHVREWDSCFTPNHSYIHGMTIRAQTTHRYRQWLTHKLGSWHDQYGRSGCVGCGRCITWCPVGIDITAEVAAISGKSHD